MTFREQYPAWYAWGADNFGCSPCAEKMKKARSAKGKKKARGETPACYNGCCGNECRDSLNKLIPTPGQSGGVPSTGR